MHLFRFFLLSALLYASTSRATPIARFGATTVTAEEFSAYLSSDSSLLSEERREGLLQSYLNMRIVAAEARRLGLDNSAQIKAQVEQLLYHAYVQKELEPVVGATQVSEAQIKALYNQQPMIKTKQILFKYKPNISDSGRVEVQSKAKGILDQIIKKTITFEQAAKKNSDDFTRESGGVMPDGGRSSLIPIYYETALKLKPGEVSQPIESIFGVHLIQLEQKIPFDQSPPGYRFELLAQIKNDLGQKILDQKIAELRKKHGLEILKKPSDIK